MITRKSIIEKNTELENENKELKAENERLRKAIEEALVKLHEFDEHMSFPNAWTDLKRITKILGEASSQEGSKGEEK